jgi:hypothetical protein
LGIEEIEAGIWGGGSLQTPRKGSPAIVNMIFRSDCGLLPLHIHPNSYRVIFILEGNGFGYFSTETLREFGGKSVSRVSLRRGSVLCYGGETLHTFGTESHGIELLTYHSAYFPFEENEQYAVPIEYWSPSSYVSIKSVA